MERFSVSSVVFAAWKAVGLSTCLRVHVCCFHDALVELGPGANMLCSSVTSIPFHKCNLDVETAYSSKNNDSLRFKGAGLFCLYMKDCLNPFQTCVLNTFCGNGLLYLIALADVTLAPHILAVFLWVRCNGPWAAHRFLNSAGGSFLHPLHFKDAISVT